MLPELWCYVIEFLDCDDICCLNLVNKYFYQICKNSDSYMKRKMRGFPRSTGHCGNHEVFDFDFIKKFWSENHTREEEVVLFEKTVTKLKAMKADLVRGDLILYPNHSGYTRHGLRMYDGHKIIDLNYQYSSMGDLPAKFNIINDSVPIHYWYQDRKTDHIGWLVHIGERGFHISDCVWFNHSTVRQQCLDNIVNKEGKVYTTFTYIGKDHTLFYIGSDGEEKFKHCLRKEQLLLIFSDKNKLELPYIHDYYK